MDNKHMILKISGVPGNALGPLSTLLAYRNSDDPKRMTDHAIQLTDPEATGGKPIPLRIGTSILDIKRESPQETFFVEIKVPIMVECDIAKVVGLSGVCGKNILFPSRKIILAIFDALGIFPEKEKIVPPSEI